MSKAAKIDKNAIPGLRIPDPINAELQKSIEKSAQFTDPPVIRAPTRRFTDPATGVVENKFDLLGRCGIAWQQPSKVWANTTIKVVDDRISSRDEVTLDQNSIGVPKGPSVAQLGEQIPKFASFCLGEIYQLFGNRANVSRGRLLWEAISVSTEASDEHDGLYSIRLFCAGMWRSIIVDDLVPVDSETGNVFVIHGNPIELEKHEIVEVQEPKSKSAKKNKQEDVMESDPVEVEETTELVVELWPLLLAKAILALHHETPCRDMLDPRFSLCHVLAAWLPEDDAPLCQPWTLYRHVCASPWSIHDLPWDELVTPTIDDFYFESWDQFNVEFAQVRASGDTEAIEQLEQAKSEAMERRRAQWQRRSKMVNPKAQTAGQKSINLPVSVLAFREAQIAVESRRQALQQRLFDRRSRVLRFVTLQPDAPQLSDNLKGTSVLLILESRGQVGQTGNGWAVRVSGFGVDCWVEGDELCEWVTNGVVTLQSWIEHTLRPGKFVLVGHKWTLTQEVPEVVPDTKASDGKKGKASKEVAPSVEDNKIEVVKPAVKTIPDDALLTFVVNPSDEIVEKVNKATAAANAVATGSTKGKGKTKESAKASPSGSGAQQGQEENNEVDEQDADFLRVTSDVDDGLVQVLILVQADASDSGMTAAKLQVFTGEMGIFGGDNENCENGWSTIKDAYDNETPGQEIVQSSWYCQGTSPGTSRSIQARILRVKPGVPIPIRFSGTVGGSFLIVASQRVLVLSAADAWNHFGEQDKVHVQKYESVLPCVQPGACHVAYRIRLNPPTLFVEENGDVTDQEDLNKDTETNSGKSVENFPENHSENNVENFRVVAHLELCDARYRTSVETFVIDHETGETLPQPMSNSCIADISLSPNNGKGYSILGLVVNEGKIATPLGSWKMSLISSFAFTSESMNNVNMPHSYSFTGEYMPNRGLRLLRDVLPRGLELGNSVAWLEIMGRGPDSKTADYRPQMKLVQGSIDGQKAGVLGCGDTVLRVSNLDPKNQTRCFLLSLTTKVQAVCQERDNVDETEEHKDTIDANENAYVVLECVAQGIVNEFTPRAPHWDKNQVEADSDTGPDKVPKSSEKGKGNSGRGSISSIAGIPDGVEKEKEGNGKLRWCLHIASDVEVSLARDMVWEKARSELYAKWNKVESGDKSMPRATQGQCARLEALGKLEKAAAISPVSPFLATVKGMSATEEDAKRERAEVLALLACRRPLNYMGNGAVGLTEDEEEECALRGVKALRYAEEDEKESLDVEQFLRDRAEATEVRALRLESLKQANAKWYQEEIKAEGFEQGLVQGLDEWRAQRIA